MRFLIWLVLFSMVLLALILPAVYYRAASKLPPLSSEFDLEKQLRHSIEGERKSYQAALADKSPRPVEYKRPDLARLPKDLVAMYIAQQGCPTYFQTPREEGFPWAWRLFMGLLGNPLPGDGACERHLALQLTVALGIQGELEQTVAAHRIHSFLQKDQLVAYDLSALYFERGVVGVEDAGHMLLEKELGAMDLGELAEVALTLPPYQMYFEGIQCKNPTLLRQNRDVVLTDLATNKLVTEERARAAMDKAVACDK